MFFRTVKTQSGIGRLFRTGICLLGVCGAFSSGAAGDWRASLSQEPPGNFPQPRPLRAKYSFGWGGITAASGEAHFTKPSESRFQLDGSGRTSGLARALWKFDAKYRATANAATLLPLETDQTEIVRGKKIVTHLSFTHAGVTRARTEGPDGSAATKTRQFNFPHLFDLHSALLYLRSQPLKERSVHRIVVYPTSSAYLATTTVLGREKISVQAGNYNAIKIDLQLNKLGKKLELEPHRKFRKATIWISDDADRVILRIEAQIFVGTVFAELQSVRFDKSKS